MRSQSLYWNNIVTDDLKEGKIKDLSEEQYEMSRDFLYPELDPQTFEHQRVMRTDLRRQAALGPNLMRLEEIMEEIGHLFRELKGCEPEDQMMPENYLARRRKNAMAPVMDHA